MKIVDLATMKETVLSPDDKISCALGNFDGVHLGHRELLKLTTNQKEYTTSAVWTFSEPSSHTTSGASLLTSSEERLEIFKSLGIKLVFLSDFAEVRNMDAQSFIRDMLFRDCHVRHAVCGFNFRYGYKASGDAALLQKEMKMLGGTVSVVPAFTMNGEVVSSSAVREALQNGETEKAASMLSTPYSLTAEVLHGKKLGRTLGFPTVNQIFPKDRATLRYGVYVMRITVDGKCYGGVGNVGLRPTVEDATACNCETYLLEYDGDLYGKTVKTEFLHFLRSEQKFESKEALQKAVHKNIEEATAYFAANKGIL